MRYLIAYDHRQNPSMHIKSIFFLQVPTGTGVVNTLIISILVQSVLRTTAYFEQIVESLKTKKYRNPTEKNYHQIWTQFNAFIINLDHMPTTWEDRLIIYITSLIQIGRASQTIKSYISAINSVLQTENVITKDDSYTLASLMKACKYKNNKLQV